MDEALTVTDSSASSSRAAAADSYLSMLMSSSNLLPYNLPLINAFLAFAIAQFLKLFTTWYKERRWDSKRIIGSAGMPSSHSATVTALAAAIGLQEGTQATSFAVAVVLACIVGEDEFGYMLAEILKENNVNNQGMRFDPGARTALAFVTLRSDGEREFMFYRNPSADMLLQEDEIDLGLITKAKVFHYGSISLITEPCKSAHIAAMKAAKDAGVILSYDPNLRLPLWPSADSAREGILSIWDTADIIKISEEEISFLTKGEDPYDDAAVRKLVLVTEGADGCRYYTKEFSGRVKGFNVDQVRDNRSRFKRSTS